MRNPYSPYGSLGDAVEVVEVHGKSNFDVYSQLLRAAGIRYAIVADLDFLFEKGSVDIKALFRPDTDRMKEQLRREGSRDGASVLRVLGKVSEGECEAIRAEADALRQHLAGRFGRLRTGLNEEDDKALRAYLEEQTEKRTFFLRAGSMEDYFPLEIGKDLERQIEHLARDDWRNGMRNMAELEGIMRRVVAATCSAI